MLDCNMSKLKSIVVVYLVNNYDEGEMNFILLFIQISVLCQLSTEKDIEKVEKKVICSIYVCYMYQGWYEVW